jgi:hypothetical protein
MDGCPDRDSPGMNVALVRGEEVAAVVVRDRTVPFDARSTGGRRAGDGCGGHGDEAAAGTDSGRAVLIPAGRC